MVREQMALIQDVQTDEWWQDVTVPMLEAVRRRLRDLVKLIEKRKRKPIYTDFEDEMGGETDVELARLRPRHRLREVPRQGAGVPARASGPRRHPQAADEQAADRRRPRRAGAHARRERRRRRRTTSSAPQTESQGLGLFVRSLVGLDREAAKEALAGFLAGKTLGANQIEFVNLIVDHLTEHGVMEPALLYESPFTDLTPQRAGRALHSAQVDELMRSLDAVRATAVAA